MDNNNSKEKISTDKNYLLEDANLYQYLQFIVKNLKILFSIFIFIFIISTSYQLTNPENKMIFVETVVFDEINYLNSEKFYYQSLNTNKFLNDNRVIISPITTTKISDFNKQIIAFPAIEILERLNPEIKIDDIKYLLKSESNYRDFLVSEKLNAADHALIFEKLFFLDEFFLDNKNLDNENLNEESNNVVIFLKHYGNDESIDYELFLNNYVEFTVIKYSKIIEDKLVNKFNELKDRTMANRLSLEKYIKLNSKVTTDDITNHIESIKFEINLCKEYLENCLVGYSNLYFSNNEMTSDEITDFSINWLYENLDFYNQYNSSKSVLKLYENMFSDIINFSETQDVIISDLEKKVKDFNISEFLFYDEFASDYYKTLIFKEIGNNDKDIFRIFTISLSISIIITLISLLSLMFYRGYKDYEVQIKK